MRLGDFVFSWGSCPQIKPAAQIPITQAEISGILQIYKPKYIRITDGVKTAYDLDTYRQICSLDLVKLKPYVAEIFDCDNYSLQQAADAQDLVSNPAFGIVDVVLPDGGLHSLCFFITSGLDLWYMEPQTGSCFPFSSVTYKPYFFSI